MTIAPSPPIDLKAWAEDNVIFPAGTPRPGEYKSEDFPFNDRLFDVLNPEHPSREVTLGKGAQVGGTILSQIFAGAVMDLAPCPFLYTHPTEPNGRRWMKLKFRPFIKASPKLSKILATEKTKDSSVTNLFVERKDGRGAIQVAGAASAASLSEISVKCQVQDDLAKWEENSAGDPEGQADSRSKAYLWAKIFKVGTPLVEDNCRVTKALKAGSHEEWQVPCPHCGYRHALDLASFMAGVEAEDADLDHPYFVCPSCGGLIFEHHLGAMNRAARAYPDKGWVARHPERMASRPSFHMPSYISPLCRWAEMAHKWHDAKGDPAAEQTVYNDYFGLAYPRAGEAPPAEKLMERSTQGLSRGIVPAGHPLLTLGLDCQGDRVEGQLVAFGPHRRRAVVDYFVVPGHISEDETRAELDKLARSTWKNQAGRKVALDLVAIDGNAWTDDVYDWAKKFARSQVIMVRGVRGDAAEIIAPVRRDSEGKGRRGRRRTYGNRFFNVGTSGIKATLYEFLKREDPLARGYVSFARGLTEEYFNQLTSEKRIQVKTRAGGKKFVWDLPKGKANEGLDTMVYAEAAATLKGWTRWDEETWDQLILEHDTPPDPTGTQLDLETLLVTTPSLKEAAPPAAAPADPEPGRLQRMLSRLV